jgi:ureidoglycolate lyase
MILPLEPLTADAFATFGDVIDRPEAAHDAEGPGWRWWGERLVLDRPDRPFAAGYLALEPAPLTFDWAERHMRSAEAVVPLGGDLVLYVGPPDHPDEPGRLPPLERFRAFVVRSGQAVVLGRGVWHGAPLVPEGPLAALVLLAEGTAREDLHLARFPDTPVEIRRT